MPCFPITVFTSSPSHSFYSYDTISETNCEQDSDKADVETDDDLKIREIVSYRPPGPPPKTGKHRYVFLVLAPTNATTEPLHLKAPAERQHWGYDGYGGVREWAVENGLTVVGGNFIYAKNKKQ